LRKNWVILCSWNGSFLGSLPAKRLAATRAKTGRVLANGPRIVRFRPAEGKQARIGLRRAREVPGAL